MARVIDTSAAQQDEQSIRGFEINSAPPQFSTNRDLPAGFLDFFWPLHRHFTPWQQQLTVKRKEVLRAAHGGKLPHHLPPSPTTQSAWQITLPDYITDQRNQMTGPADDAELVVKMLNSGAPGVMLDLEDSMANYWSNLELGIQNILSALIGKLTYFDKKKKQTVAINKDTKTVILNRARGLHLSQRSVTGSELTSASLYDVCRLAFAVNVKELRHNLTFYIPKSESAEEALWWAELFKEIAKARGWEADYIKCMALVESHPLAHQMEEFLYHLRDHILGLNLGRWDYMASLIHFNLNDPGWVLPDRNTIPYDVQFFQNLRELIPEICHRRGCLAIGGMTALFPDRANAALNQRALTVLAKDKKNEADCGMDGAWTGHPDQNAIAVAQFPQPNQLGYRKAKAERYPDLRPLPSGVGKRSLAGTRAAIRTVIRYRNGVLHGKGASLLDGYMEDLATDRIYRLMIAQRIKHCDKVEITDESGRAVRHTPEWVTKLFDEELEKILKDFVPPTIPEHEAQLACNRFRQARRVSEAMIRNQEFDPI